MSTPLTDADSRGIGIQQRLQVHEGDAVTVTTSHGHQLTGVAGSPTHDPAQLDDEGTASSGASVIPLSLTDPPAIDEGPLVDVELRATERSPGAWSPPVVSARVPEVVHHDAGAEVVGGRYISLGEITDLSVGNESDRPVMLVRIPGIDVPEAADATPELAIEQLVARALAEEAIDHDGPIDATLVQNPSGEALRVEPGVVSDGQLGDRWIQANGTEHFVPIGADDD